MIHIFETLRVSAETADGVLRKGSKGISHIPFLGLDYTLGVLTISTCLETGKSENKMRDKAQKGLLQILIIFATRQKNLEASLKDNLCNQYCRLYNLS